MDAQELAEQNAAIRASMADTSVLLDRAYGPSAARLELRIAQLIRRESLGRERIDILAGMVRSLRAEIARKDVALTTIADILKQRDQEGWEERLQAIARAALEASNAELDAR